MRTMTELEIMSAVANHPRVQAYRKAVQIMHTRMVAAYGVDYAQEYIPTDNLDFAEGIKRMTPLDADRFDSLMRGAAATRRDVRASILATL